MGFFTNLICPFAPSRPQNTNPHTLGSPQPLNLPNHSIPMDEDTPDNTRGEKRARSGGETGMTPDQKKTK